MLVSSFHLNEVVLAPMEKGGDRDIVFAFESFVQTSTSLERTIVKTQEQIVIWFFNLI